MRKKSKSSSTSKARGSRDLNLFGPPPILDGEDEAAYEEMVARVYAALEPRDFIEEMWVHDLVGEAWKIIRSRQLLAAFLADKVRYHVNDKASEMVNDDPKLMEGTETEKEEMEKLTNDDLGTSWGKLTEMYPRAYARFLKFWNAAEATLDKDLIQATVVAEEMDTIERFERQIAVAQHRFDAIMRESDRHRFAQHQLDSMQKMTEGELKTVHSVTAPKIAAKKAA